MLLVETSSRVAARLLLGEVLARLLLAGRMYRGFALSDIVVQLVASVLACSAQSMVETREIPCPPTQVLVMPRRPLALSPSLSLSFCLSFSVVPSLSLSLCLSTCGCASCEARLRVERVAGIPHFWTSGQSEAPLSTVHRHQLIGTAPREPAVYWVRCRCPCMHYFYWRHRTSGRGPAPGLCCVVKLKLTNVVLLSCPMVNLCKKTPSP